LPRQLKHSLFASTKFFLSLAVFDLNSVHCIRECLPLHAAYVEESDVRFTKCDFADRDFSPDFATEFGYTVECEDLLGHEIHQDDITRRIDGTAYGGLPFHPS